MGIVVAAMFVAVSAFFGASLPEPVVRVFQIIVPVLWPSSRSLGPVGDPADEYQRWLVAVLTNAIPYGVLGAVVYLASRLFRRRHKQLRSIPQRYP